MTAITDNHGGVVGPTSLAGVQFWFGWVLAGLVGWGVGGYAGVALGTPGYIIENGYMSIALGGFLTGVLQWLVLRPKLGHTGWWAPAGMVAALVFGAVVFGGLAADPGGTWITDVAWIVGASLFMPAAAWLQWRRVLRRHFAGGPGWWILANLVGFFGGGLIGGGLMGVLFGFSGKEAGLDAFAVWSAFGAVYGALTGGALIRLSRRPVRSSAS